MVVIPYNIINFTMIYLLCWRLKMLHVVPLVDKSTQTFCAALISLNHNQNIMLFCFCGPCEYRPCVVLKNVLNVSVMVPTCVFLYTWSCMDVARAHIVFCATAVAICNHALYDKL